MPHRRRAPVVRILTAIILIADALGPARVDAATDRLPDLRMDPLSKFYTENSGGQRQRLIQGSPV